MSNLLKVIKYMNANYGTIAPDKFTISDEPIVRRALKKYGIKVYHGATRIAFVDPTNHKFVLKMSYADSSYDKHPFYDLCAIENAFYEDAKSNGVDKMLLKNELIHTCNGGIKLYKQERYTYDVNAVIESGHYPEFRAFLKDTPKTVKSDDVNFVLDNAFDIVTDVSWVIAAINTYGVRMMRDFCRWTCAHKINDLHACNTGFVGRRPVVFDYAGYHRDYSTSENFSDSSY